MQDLKKQNTELEAKNLQFEILKNANKSKGKDGYFSEYWRDSGKEANLRSMVIKLLNEKSEKTSLILKLKEQLKGTFLTKFSQ